MGMSMATILPLGARVMRLRGEMGGRHVTVAPPRPAGRGRHPAGRAGPRRLGDERALPGPARPGARPVLPKYRLFNAAVERLWNGDSRWNEGPVWIGDARCVIWSDIPNNRLLRWSETTGQVDEFRKPSGYANGNTRD